MSVLGKDEKDAEKKHEEEKERKKIVIIATFFFSLSRLSTVSYYSESQIIQNST